MGKEKDKSQEQDQKNEPNEENQKSSEESLKQKEQQYEELLDKYLRLGADFENSRKRWERERYDLIRFANSSLLKEFISVVDEMEHALKAVKNNTSCEETVKGLEMLYDNFLGILKKNGIQVIEALGKKFDPHFHEIAGSKEVKEDNQEHIVLEEVQRGYLFEEKVLRTSKVIVGVCKKPETRR